MRTVFGRMFLSFWLTLVLTLVVAGVLMVVLTPRFRHGGPGAEAAALWRGELLPIHAAEVQEAFAREGATGVDGYLAAVEGRTGVRMFVVPTQPEWTRRRPPRSVTRFASHHRGGRERPFARHFGPLYVATAIELGDAAHLQLVAEIRGPGMRGGPPPVHRRSEVLLVALLLTSGATCFVLARSLTRPIRALQRASREMADGNLDVRVGDAMAGRRDELAGLARDFDHMAERIQSLRHTEQRLLRDVSHELRSPLARLQVALELARARAGEAAGESLDRIEREAGRLNDIIAQLLAMVRLATGEGAAPAGPVDLSGILREVVADASFEGQARGVSVEWTGPETCRVQVDESQLRSAVENVVRNAVFYTADRTVVGVELAMEGADAVVRVRDRGPGVPEDALSQLFHPFFRVAEARERDSGGAGLGLAIAAQAVRRHGGSIQAENVSDGGLCVTIQLPTTPGT